MNPLEYSFFFNKKIVSDNPHSPISQLTEYIFQEINHSSRNVLVRKQSLNNILTNLIVGHLNGRYLVISKSANEFSNYSWYGLNHYTFRLTIGWIETLIREEYINQVIGFYNPAIEKGKRTRISANEKLISTLNEMRSYNEKLSSINYTKNIILKDEDKRLIKYSPSGRLLEKIRFLNEYNELINGSQISFQVNSETLNRLNPAYPLFDDSFISFYHLLQAQEKVVRQTAPSAIPLLITLAVNQPKSMELQSQLYRVFNQGKFTRGGRFYGGEYQQLNESDRTGILINGSPVVEVDYSAFHLNMLYNLTGKQFDDDPYSVVDRPEVRPILKVMALIVINSENKSQALKALRDEIRKNWDFQKLKRMYQLDEKELLRKFESVHCNISNYFCSGIGLKLQYRDSEIAECILKHYTRQGIPCLCVHDSFLVPVQYKEELKLVMNEAYKKHIGFDAKLK